jgi:glycosyltransferase involved in cell wall biosynthesis
MKFAVIIPTRNDRPKFIEQCKKLLKRQTLQPTEVIWVDYKPESAAKDITQRYRRGVETATNKGYEFVVFWEDDDWYHSKYLEWLIGEWIKKNKPIAFGVGETYYYHHLMEGLIHYNHPERTSAFCTLLKLPVSMTWPHDSQPFLDMHIYKMLKPITIKFPHNIIYAIGIKHGIGLSGGGGHRLTHGYNFSKENRTWFISNVGNDVEFYDSIKSEMVNPNNTHNNIKNSNQSNIHKIKTNNVQQRKIIGINPNTQLPGRRK